MKQCPKCGKAYDDSWKVCLDDETGLVVVEPKDAAKVSRELSVLDIDYEKLYCETKKLRRFFGIVKALYGAYIVIFLIVFFYVATHLEDMRFEHISIFIGCVVAAIFAVNIIFFKKIKDVYGIMGERGFIMGYFTWIAPYSFGSDVYSRAKILLKNYKDVKHGKKTIFKGKWR